MAEEATMTSSIRGKLALRLSAIGIGAVFAAILASYAVTWAWSGSIERALVELRSVESEKEPTEVNASVIIARQLDDFMRERIADVRGWASVPTVIAAARQAHSAHEQAGLLDLTPEEIEKKFQVRKSLGRFPIADGFLQAEILRSEHFDRVLFTDRNGYNVVTTSVSSDFVHSDENWWQRAWSDGFTLSQVLYDESLGSWSVDISVRIDDPATDTPVGVMQAALSITLIQAITDRYPEHEDGEQRVTVVDSEGLLLAETSSDHSGARIMNEKVNVRDGGDDVRKVVFEAEHSGHVTEGEWVTGYSRTASGEFYADLTSNFRFGGFDWGVVVQSREGGGVSAGIEAVTDRIDAWRGNYAVILGGGALILGLVIGSIGWWVARRFSRPIRDLHAMTMEVSLGTSNSEVKLATNDELAEIAGAFDRMRRSLLLAVRMAHNRGAGTPRGTQPPR